MRGHNIFASKPRKQPQETARSLPPDMRQLIMDLRAELPTMSLREIADICAVRSRRSRFALGIVRPSALAFRLWSAIVAQIEGAYQMGSASGGDRRRVGKLVVTNSRSIRCPRGADPDAACQQSCRRLGGVNGVFRGGVSPRPSLFPGAFSDWQQAKARRA